MPDIPVGNAEIGKNMTMANAMPVNLKENLSTTHSRNVKFGKSGINTG